MPKAANATGKVVMPLASRRPSQASTDDTKSRPIGESFSRVSMKWAQNRRKNITVEVQIKSALPCSDENRLPVMFWIQLSVPSSTAPTRAWVTKRMKSISEPIENFVITATASSNRPPSP